jgi:hypothetical protein
MEARGISLELNLRLKFYCSWTWCFFIVFYSCFVVVVFVILFVSFIFIFIPIFFLYYQLHLHYLLIFLSPLHSPFLSFATIHCCPSQLLFLAYLFHCLPLPSPSPSILPQTITIISLLPSHSSPADQSTVPTLHNAKPLQSLTQGPYTTTTEIYTKHTRATKHSSPLMASPTHPPYFLPPLLVPL